MKRLVKPGITEVVVLNDGVTYGDGRTSEIDRRFIAASPAVAEAAVRAVEAFHALTAEGPSGDILTDRIDELRTALLLAGYTEE